LAGVFTPELYTYTKTAEVGWPDLKLEHFVTL